VEYGIQSTISLYIHFLATAMLDQVSPGKSLVVLDPDFSFASILTQHASEKGIQLTLLTTAHDSCMWPWVYIHPCATKREILENLPHDIARFVNIGGDQESMSNIKQCLPVNCDVQTEQSLTSEISYSESYDATSKVAAQIQATWMRIQNEPAPVNLLRFGGLSLHELIQNVNPPTSQFIVEWGDSKLPAQVQPASVQVRFANDKTYWLVGLTGGLGLSLCQWMARQGTRYIALSSRNPKVDEVWLRQMAASGCTIRVFSRYVCSFFTNPSAITNQPFEKVISQIARLYVLHTAIFVGQCLQLQVLLKVLWYSKTQCSPTLISPGLRECFSPKSMAAFCLTNCSRKTLSNL
jgi:hybrid polyketide synthase/nonribosomal peptide synthetase ACE1